MKNILSKRDIKEIRNTHFYKIAYYEKKSIPIDGSGNKIFFPNLEKLQEMALKSLSEKGFQIKRVAPNKANCIIRVFNKRHFPYDDYKNELHNVCGFDCFCFSKKLGEWTTFLNDDEVILDFSKWKIRQWLYQDEYVDYDCTFFDMYLLVTK